MYSKVRCFADWIILAAEKAVACFRFCGYGSLYCVSQNHTLHVGQEIQNNRTTYVLY
jgi:hypothetical protein